MYVKEPRNSGNLLPNCPITLKYPALVESIAMNMWSKYREKQEDFEFALWEELTIGERRNWREHAIEGIVKFVGANLAMVHEYCEKERD